MIALNNTDVIEGGASANSVVDFVISGLDGYTITQLAQGQLTTTYTTALLTATQSTAVSSIVLTNTDSSARTVNLYLDSADGGNPRNLIPKDLSLGAGSTLIFNGKSMTVVDTDGGMLTAPALVPLTVPKGGTGVATITDGAVVIGAAAAAIEEVTPSALGKVLVDQGSGTNPAYEYRPINNLLTNPMFNVCSKASFENYRTLSDATTTVAGTTCTSTAHALSAGMLVKDGAGVCFEVVSITDANIFEVHTTGADNNSQWYEAGPGFVGADTDAPDTWEKTNSASFQLTRIQQDSSAPVKALYELEIVNTSGSDGYVDCNLGLSDSNVALLAAFEGAEVALSCYIRGQSAASKVAIGTWEDGFQQVDINSGTGSEWLEGTRTVGTSLSAFHPFSIKVLTGETVYVTMCVLIYGASIGVGNFYKDPHWVMLEETWWLEGFDPTADTFSDVAAGEDINIEAATNMRVPKDVICLYVFLQARDSDASTGGPAFDLYSDLAGTNKHMTARIATGGTTFDDKWLMETGLVWTEDGDISYGVSASGANTIDAGIKILAVLL